MPKFNVVIEEVVQYEYTVEAPDADTACDLGLEAREQSENDDGFLCVTDRSVAQVKLNRD